METNKKSVLIIDDDDQYLELLAESLEHLFDVKTVVNIASAEDAIASHGKFDIALVDEYIDREIGSEWIKKCVDKEHGAESFVLYSGLATEEAILKGLECGADDFLAKPISLLSLASKLEKLVTYQEKIHDFESEITSKDRVINISMAQASKYGACMQLTSSLNQCFTFEQLRDEIFSFFYSMNLNACLALYPLEENPIFYSSKNGFCSPVEMGVMELLKVKPRLYRFGSRTIFNHPLASILVLNLEEGSVDTDIYIDALASVIECVGARMAFITYKNSLVGVQDQIQQAVTKTKKMIEISKHHQQEVMNEIVQNVGMSFHVLDMTDEQETYLTDLVHNALKKHTQDDINFFEVTQLLDQALSSVDRLKSLNQQQEQIDDFDDEDELFLMADSVSLSIEQIPFAVVVINDEQKIHACNQRLYALTGFDASNLCGQSLDVLFHEYSARVTRDIGTQIDGKAKSSLLRSANNGLIAVEQTIHRVETLSYYYLVEKETFDHIEDVSINDTTKQILQELGETFWEWDISTDQMYFSADLMFFLGFDRKPLVASSSFWQEHVVEHYWDDITDQVNLLFSGEASSFNANYQVLTEQQEALWVNVLGKLKRNENNKPEKLYGVIRNITESKGLIQQLRKQNNYLSLAEKISNSGHWRYDVKSEKMFWSTELYRIYGTDPATFVPSIENELAFHLEDERDGIRDNVLHAIENARSYYNKSTIILHSGKKTKIETIGEVEVDSKGDVIALFGICRDITKSEIIFEKLKLLAMVNYTIKVPIFFINEEDNVVYQDLSPQQGDGNTVLFNYVNFSISEYLKLKKNS